MNQRHMLLRSSTAVALLAFGGGALVGLPARAACTTAGGTTTCDASAPNPRTTTLGGGRNDDGRTVVLQNGAAIEVTNQNGISLGDDASITLRAGSTVSGNQSGGSGNYGTGNNVIEFNSNGTLVIANGAQVVKTGSQSNAEVVNVHGFGNVIQNRGLIRASTAAAIWFEDQDVAASLLERNRVDNFGTIERVGGSGSVIGSNQGAGIIFRNRTGGEVIGGISFGGGDDILEFQAGSLVTGSINGGGGTNELILSGAAGSSDTLAGAVANFERVDKVGAGKWEISGALTGIDVTRVLQGTLALTGNNTGYDGQITVFAPGILEARAQSLPTVPGTNADNVTNNGPVRFTQPDNGTYIGQIVGSGAVEKTGAGVLTLAPANPAGNTWSGGTFINQGTVSVAADSALGAASGILSFDGGVLGTTASFAMDRATTLQAGGGTFQTSGGTELTQAGAIGGAGRLTKSGAGTLILASANSYAGGTAINGGVLEIAANNRLGSAAAPLSVNGGTLRTTANVAMNRDATLLAGGGGFETLAGTTLSFAGDIGGPGALRKSGDGTFVLTGTGSFAGGTTIAAGTFQLGNGGTTGSVTGPIANNGVLIVDRSNGVLLDGAISGTGALRQVGSGTTTLEGRNSYAGPTTVEAGRLLVNGNQFGARGATAVADGATLGGNGFIGGDVAMADGATLEPGRAGTAPGSLNIRGDLAQSAGSVMNYGFGRSGVVGGPFNDLTRVLGDLTLDGTLNVDVSPGGTFEPGIYRVITYLGTLTNNTLEIGRIPSPDFFVQTSIRRQVNLVNTAGETLYYWDGDAGPKNDGFADGGDGTWQNLAGNDDWTEATGQVNAPFADRAFAIFPGVAGTVTVDNGLGAVRASGMQFLTDGYRIVGDPITLVGTPSSTIRVGDGSTEGAEITTTIDARLDGATELRKADLGTLVLTAANSYSGGTAIDGGILQVSADANLGAADGAISLDDGTLRTTRSIATDRDVTLDASGGTLEQRLGTRLTLSAPVTGPGALTKSGAGTLLLTGDGSYAGGTTITAGQLRLGDGGTSGAILGDVANDGTLVFDRSDEVTFPGAISGTGNVWQSGSGTTILTGTNSHSGATLVAAGTLEAGAAGVLSPASAHVVRPEATLEFADFSQRVAALSNAGRVSLGDVPGTVLTVRGGYAGNGGLLHFSTALGGDGSPTDRMVVQGGTSGTTRVEVDNVGGTGAETSEGIRIIDVGGASAGQFSLLGDYVIDGQPAVIAGAYGYTLQQNGLSDPADGDWYLRSSLVREVPDRPGRPDRPTLLQPGVPIYEAYAQTLLSLNGLPTMQERIGNRYWSGAGNPPGFQTTTVDGREVAASFTEDQRAWVRLEGSWSHLEPDVPTGSDDWDIDTWKLQVGFDRLVHESDDGLLVGGLTFHYGEADTDVSSFFGDGSIETEGYGLGASLTWFGYDGVYVDGQAQLTWYDSDLTSGLLGRDLTSGNDGFGYALGVEAGKRIDINDDWTMTPQGQLIYSSVDFDDFTDPFGAEVSPDDSASMPARLGISLDQESARLDDRQGEVRTHFYGIVNLEYDLLDGTGVSVGGTSLSADNDRLWGSIAVGASYAWDGGTNAVYGEGLVATSLSNFTDSYTNRATFGFRTVW